MYKLKVNDKEASWSFQPKKNCSEMKSCIFTWEDTEKTCLLIFRAVFVDYLEYSYDRDHFSLAVLEIRLEGLHRSLYNWEESIYHLLNEFFFPFVSWQTIPLPALCRIL